MMQECCLASAWCQVVGQMTYNIYKYLLGLKKVRISYISTLRFSKLVDKFCMVLAVAVAVEWSYIAQNEWSLGQSFINELCVGLFLCTRGIAHEYL